MYCNPLRFAELFLWFGPFAYSHDKTDRIKEVYYLNCLKDLPAWFGDCSKSKSRSAANLKTWLVPFVWAVPISMWLVLEKNRWQDGDTALDSVEECAAHKFSAAWIIFPTVWWPWLGIFHVQKGPDLKIPITPESSWAVSFKWPQHQSIVHRYQVSLRFWVPGSFLRDHDKQRHPRAFQTTTWNHSLATLVEQPVSNSRYVYQLPFIRSEPFSWFHLEKCPWECEASLEEVQSRQQHLADCAWSWDDNGRAAPSHFSAIGYSTRADVIPKYHYGVVFELEGQEAQKSLEWWASNDQIQGSGEQHLWISPVLFLSVIEPGNGQSLIISISIYYIWIRLF